MPAKFAAAAISSPIASGQIDSRRAMITLSMTARCSSGIVRDAATNSSEPASEITTSRRNRQQYAASRLIQRASLLRWLSMSSIRPRLRDGLLIQDFQHASRNVSFPKLTASPVTLTPDSSRLVRLLLLAADHGALFPAAPHSFRESSGPLVRRR